MSDLRSLFPDSRFAITETGAAFNQLYIYNTNTGNQCNNGQCCLWTVPANTCWAKFEVWGGGGSGGGACCCQQPSKGGGAGSYVRKTTRVTPGQSYTICAAGSGCCSVDATGQGGYPSYVCNPSATYPVCLCASGGDNGQSCCWAAIGGNYHCSSNVSGSTCGGDFGLCSLQGSSHMSWCGFDTWHMIPSGPMTGGTRMSRTSCGESWMGCDMAGGYNSFPGGGGGTAISYGGCCWGGWGAGGLVIITYK